MNHECNAHHYSLVLAVAARCPADAERFVATLPAGRMLSDLDFGVSIAVAGKRDEFAASGVNLVECPRATSAFQLWLAAILNSSSRYVALLDANCPPAEGWFTSVRHGIENSRPIFFGPVDPGWPADDRRIIGYLNEYAQFRSPLDPDIEEYPGNNLVFRRALLNSMYLGPDGFHKTFFVAHVRELHALVPTGCNSMKVLYKKPYETAHYLRRRFNHARLYAAKRSTAVWWLYAAAMPALPILRVYRIFRAVEHDSLLRRAFFRFFPEIMLSESAWSAGEFVGYVAGPPATSAFLD